MLQDMEKPTKSTKNSIANDNRFEKGLYTDTIEDAWFKSKQYFVKMVKITPEMAAEILAKRVGIVHNNSNVRVEQYAAVMANKSWEITHQGLSFNWNGELCDGFLRLNSIIMSKEPIVTPITFGLDPTVFRAVDTGFGRKAKHMLVIDGFSDKIAGPAASGIGLYLRYTHALKKGKILAAGRLSEQQKFEFCETHPDFIETVEAILHEKQTWKEVMPMSAAIALVYMARQNKHPLKLPLNFLQGIGNFAGQDKYHPILNLYKTLHKDKMSDKRVKAGDVLAKSIRAYDKWVKKDGLQNVLGIGNKKVNESATNYAFVMSQNFPRLTKYVKSKHRTLAELEN